MDLWFKISSQFSPKNAARVTSYAHRPYIFFLPVLHTESLRATSQTLTQATNALSPSPRYHPALKRLNSKRPRDLFPISSSPQPSFPPTQPHTLILQRQIQAHKPIFSSNHTTLSATSTPQLHTNNVLRNRSQPPTVSPPLPLPYLHPSILTPPPDP